MNFYRLSNELLKKKTNSFLKNQIKMGESLFTLSSRQDEEAGDSKLAILKIVSIVLLLALAFIIAISPTKL